MVTRISKMAASLSFFGHKLNEQVLRWEKKNKSILLREASFINFAYNVYDGTRNIFKSVGLEGAFDGIMKAVEVAITVSPFSAFS